MKKFTITYNTGEKGLPTLFRYQYFTIDAEERKDWDYEKLNSYLGKYDLKVSDSVLNSNKGQVLETLLDLNSSGSCFVVSKNNGERYSGKKQYIKCRIPVYVLKSIKKIFISTLVYDSEGQKTPVPEIMEFSFDPVNKVVEITDLTLYEPEDNLFFKYARNAVDSLSVEAIGLSQYNVEQEKSVKDFYDRNQMTPWKKTAKLDEESELANQAGIYMLYDSNKNHFYVGKAIRLKERIIQHKNNIDDPIQGFTHYRYSVISMEYFEFLYLIENAAIHDFAWLLNMPKAKKYAPPLVKVIGDMDFEKCCMVNTAEHQTRKQ